MRRVKPRDLGEPPVLQAVARASEMPPETTALNHTDCPKNNKGKITNNVPTRDTFCTDHREVCIRTAEIHIVCVCVCVCVCLCVGGVKGFECGCVPERRYSMCKQWSARQNYFSQKAVINMMSIKSLNPTSTKLSQ